MKQAVIKFETKKETIAIELVYLRSPPALSAGPHMENQPKVPWAPMSALHLTPPSQPRRLCRNLAHSRHPTATGHSHLQQRQTTLLISWNTNNRKALDGVDEQDVGNT